MRRSPRAGRRPCRSCRCSTRISRSGSAPGCSGEVLEGEISFWRRQLAGLPPLLELPTDRPRPAVQSFRGATRPVRLPAGLTRQVEALGRREGATLFMVLLAGFQALLARYSGQQDLAVGTPVAGRNRVEIEGLIGFFVNTLVLRGDLHGRADRSASCSAGSARPRSPPMRTRTCRSKSWSRSCSPERSLAATPLFQVMLRAAERSRRGAWRSRSLRLRPVTAGRGDGEVRSHAQPRGSATAGWRHDASTPPICSTPTTIDRLIGHFERLLAAAVAEPERTGRRAAAARRRRSATSSCVEWNDTAADRARAACVHELFERRRRARRRPWPWCCGTER